MRAGCITHYEQMRGENGSSKVEHTMMSWTVFPAGVLIFNRVIRTLSCSTPTGHYKVQPSYCQRTNKTHSRFYS